MTDQNSSFAMPPLTPTLHPSVVYAADMAALTAVLGAFAGYLPTIAAGMAALWYGIAIIDAVRRWIRG